MIVQTSILIIFISIISLIGPSFVDAQVVINEFSSFSTGDDWIELYNTSQNEIDLNGWKIKDSASTPVEKFEEQLLIPAGGYCSIGADKRLNKDEDKIELYQSDVLKDCVSYGKANMCTGKSKSDVDAPLENQTASRSPNG